MINRCLFLLGLVNAVSFGLCVIQWLWPSVIMLLLALAIAVILSGCWGAYLCQEHWALAVMRGYVIGSTILKRGSQILIVESTVFTILAACSCQGWVIV